VVFDVRVVLPTREVKPIIDMRSFVPCVRLKVMKSITIAIWLRAAQAYGRRRTAALGIDPADIPARVREFLKGTAQPNGPSSAAQEQLRMQAHPGIVFVTTTNGDRLAALSAGPQVWTVAEAWLQYGEDERIAAVAGDALGLAAADVETALAYWADYQDETDDLIRRHHASQDEALAAWERRRALDAI
jgi:hypothetical protein